MTTEQNGKPDPKNFLTNDKPREYTARIKVSGSMTVTIFADSKEDAERQAEEMADEIAEGDDCPELDEVDDVDVAYVAKRGPLYLIDRNGQNMQASWLEAGDKPRQPDERGF